VAALKLLAEYEAAKRLKLAAPFCGVTAFTARTSPCGTRSAIAAEKQRSIASAAPSPILE
jgi:hypothetical protein